MTQNNNDKAAADDVPSPCIGVCTIDEETDFCLGCARSLQEVARWKRLTADEKRAVLSVLPDRKAEMLALGVDGRWRRP